MRVSWAFIYDFMGLKSEEGEMVHYVCVCSTKCHYQKQNLILSLKQTKEPTVIKSASVVFHYLWVFLWFCIFATGLCISLIIFDCIFCSRNSACASIFVLGIGRNKDSKKDLCVCVCNLAFICMLLYIFFFQVSFTGMKQTWKKTVQWIISRTKKWQTERATG